MQWLWRVTRSIPLAVLSGLLALVVFAAAPLILLAGLFGLATGAAWLWLRHPHLLVLTAEAFGVAAAALVVAALAGFAREAVRALRFRLDPVARQRAYGFYVPSWHTRPGWPTWGVGWRS